MAAPVVKNLADIAKGGRQLYDIAGNILDRFAKKLPGAKQVPLPQALAEIAAMPQAEFEKQVEEIVELTLADKSPEYRKIVTEYVKLVLRLLRAGIVRLISDPAAINGIFTLLKDDGLA